MAVCDLEAWTVMITRLGSVCVCVCICVSMYVCMCVCVLLFRFSGILHGCQNLYIDCKKCIAFRKSCITNA